MALLNPAYVVIVPFLFLFTIPLAIFAGITTTFAFTILIFRVVLVYTDLVLALLPSYLTFRRNRRYPPRSVALNKTPTAVSPTSKSASRSPSPVLNNSSRNLSLTRIRRARSRRPSSAASLASAATPIANEGGLGLIPSIGLERDFEGIGGWRMGDTDDERWTMINSRLELPDRQHTVRQHHRSPSGGDGGILMMKGRNRNRSGSPETVIFMNGTRTPASPNSSRVRTPGNAPSSMMTMEGRETEYFPSTPLKSARKVAV